MRWQKWCAFSFYLIKKMSVWKVQIRRRHDSDKSIQSLPSLSHLIWIIPYLFASNAHQSNTHHQSAPFVPIWISFEKSFSYLHHGKCCRNACWTNVLTLFWLISFPTRQISIHFYMRRKCGTCFAANPKPSTCCQQRLLLVLIWIKSKIKKEKKKEKKLFFLRAKPKWQKKNENILIFHTQMQCKHTQRFRLGTQLIYRYFSLVSCEHVVCDAYVHTVYSLQLYTVQCTYTWEIVWTRKWREREFEWKFAQNTCTHIHTHVRRAQTHPLTHTHTPTQSHSFLTSRH